MAAVPLADGGFRHDQPRDLGARRSDDCVRDQRDRGYRGRLDDSYSFWSDPDGGPVGMGQAGHGATGYLGRRGQSEAGKGHAVNTLCCPHCDANATVELIPPQYTCSGCGKSWPVPPDQAGTTDPRSVRPAAGLATDVSKNLIDGP